MHLYITVLRKVFGFWNLISSLVIHHDVRKTCFCCMGEGMMNFTLWRWINSLSCRPFWCHRRCGRTCRRVIVCSLVEDVLSNETWLHQSTPLTFLRSPAGWMNSLHRVRNAQWIQTIAASRLAILMNECITFSITTHARVHQTDSLQRKNL